MSHKYAVQALDRFVIGREDVGEVQFLLPVDVTGLDLDDVIDIEKGKIQVYGLPGSAAAPSPGAGLNVPSMLIFRCADTLLRSWLIAQCLVEQPLTETGSAGTAVQV